MSNRNKARIEQYRNIIKDFCNGTDTDQIITEYFNNLRKTFYFSNTFIKKTQKIFPPKKIFLNKFKKRERKLFDLILERDEICLSINGSIPSANWFRFKKYNSKEQMFVFEESKSNIDYLEHYTEHLVPRDEIEDYSENNIDKKDLISITDIRDRRLGYLRKLVHLEELIENLTDKLKTGSIAEIESKAVEYVDNISFTHDFVYTCQNKLKDALLQMISHKENFYKTERFKEILTEYNQIKRPRTVVVKDDKLEEVCPFDDENYFMFPDMAFYRKQGGWGLEKIFHEPLIYFLVELLKEYGPLRIKRCAHCNNFFFVKRIVENNRFCSDSCRVSYHGELQKTPEGKKKNREKQSDRRAKERKKNQDMRRKERIEHLICSGYSPEDAEKWADDDS